MTIVARARVVLEADTIALTRALQGAEAAMKKSGARMSDIGKKLNTRLTLPLLGAGVCVT